MPESWDRAPLRGLDASGAKREAGTGPHGGAASGHLKSRVVKRSIVVGGHKTSVSLEDVFWNELRSIAKARGMHLSQLVGSIDAERQHGNLSSAIRLFVFEQVRNSSNRSERQ
jgi:predicted DNA-binding ribbon-helix-helix protein